jgi:hypothetical protein
MKIYLPDILPKTLNNKMDKLKNIKEPKIENYCEIISEDLGIMYINETTNNIYCLETTFNTNYKLIKKYDGKQDLLVDYTQYNRLPVVSQLPTDYVLTKIREHKYSLSNLTLVVEFSEEDPINFYIEYTNNKPILELDLTDTNIQEDLNVFLSYLK